MEQMVIVREILKNYYHCDVSTQLDVDAAISVLSENGTLTQQEQTVVNLTKNQSTTKEISGLLRIGRMTVYRKLNKACTKLADYLGPSYQDSKLLLAVQERLGRELTPEEEKVCWYIISTYGNRKYSQISIFNFKIENGKVLPNGDRENKKQR